MESGTPVAEVFSLFEMMPCDAIAPTLLSFVERQLTSPEPQKITFGVLGL